MWLWFASLVWAGMYKAELAIPQTHPSTAQPGLMEPSTKPTFGRYLHRRDGVPVLTIPSSHPNVFCRGTPEGWIVAEWTGADANSWPTTFPMTAFCSYAGHTLQLHIVSYKPGNDPINWSMQITHGGRAHLTAPEQTAALRVFDLPPGVGRVRGLAGYASMPTPSPLMGMPGVTCQLAEDRHGAPTILFQISATAQPGQGACLVPRKDASTYRIEVELARYPLAASPLAAPSLGDDVLTHEERAK